MVRFEKFENGHDLDFEPDLSDIKMTSRDVTRIMTSCARRHCYIMATNTQVIHKVTFGVGTRGWLPHVLSRPISKRHGRFRSFLASKLPWPRLLDMWKFVILDPISWPWENFLVSMATKSFPWKQTSPDFFRSRPGPPCQVWPPSAHKRRRSFRTNAATDTTQIIVRFTRARNKKCNLTLAMSPTCHSNDALVIWWHDIA